MAGEGGKGGAGGVVRSCEGAVWSSLGLEIMNWIRMIELSMRMSEYGRVIALEIGGIWLRGGVHCERA